MGSTSRVGIGDQMLKLVALSLMWSLWDVGELNKDALFLRTAKYLSASHAECELFLVILSLV